MSRPTSRRMTQPNHTDPPPPPSSSFGIKSGDGRGLTSTNNDRNDGEGRGTRELPTSVKSRLFGPPMPKTQNRCRLLRVERSDGSTPLNRELLELWSSPTMVSARSEYDESDIDDIINRYTTQFPSSPPTPSQHRRTATSLPTRIYRHTTPTPQPDSSPLPISQYMLRATARQAASPFNPMHESSSSPWADRKYNNVSSLRSARGLGLSSVFRTPVSRPFLGRKRSSTTPPPDLWEEAGTPLHEVSSQRTRSRSLRGPGQHRSSLTLENCKATNSRSNIRSRLSASIASLDHMIRSKATPATPSIASTSTEHSRVSSPPIDFAGLHQSRSTMSSSNSSEFSFVEPSTSPEPAVDILARVEGCKSADQEMKETEEEACKDMMSVAPLKVTLSLAGPSENLSSGPISLGARRESVSVQPPVAVGHDLPLAATATAVRIQPTHPELKLSFAIIKTLFVERPLVPAEAEGQPHAAEPSRPSTPVEGILGGGLTPLFTVVIISAWILCALLRSIVRSTVTSQPVLAGSVVVDLLVSMMLAVATCASFHLLLGGRVESLAGLVSFWRKVEGLVEEGYRVSIGRPRNNRSK